jgi:hypothetical protein
LVYEQIITSGEFPLDKWHLFVLAGHFYTFEKMNVLAGVEAQGQIHVRFEMRIVDIPKRDHMIHGAIEISALLAQHFRIPQ